MKVCSSPTLKPHRTSTKHHTCGKDGRFVSKNKCKISNTFIGILSSMIDISTASSSASSELKVKLSFFYTKLA